MASKILYVLFLFIHYLAVDLDSAECQPYQRFVSLGNCCITRTQINHHLRKRFGKDAHSFGGGQLFDWLVIHDYNQLCVALENNLLDIFEKKDLIFDNFCFPKKLEIRNIKYNMTWNHLFAKNSDKTYQNNIIDLEYDLKKQKIDYLSNKFKELKNYRTLYILAYPFIDNKPLNTNKPNKETLIRLSKAIEKIRVNKNFDLLFCPLKCNFQSFDNILIRVIYNATNNPAVEGDYDCWNNLLNQFPFEPPLENILLNDNPP